MSSSSLNSTTNALAAIYQQRAVLDGFFDGIIEHLEESRDACLSGKDLVEHEHKLAVLNLIAKLSDELQIIDSELGDISMSLSQ